MQKKNWRKLDNGNGEMVCADVLLLCKPLKSSTFAQIIMHKLAQGLWATFVACNACKLIMRNVFITPEAIIRSSQHSKSAFQCVYWPVEYLKTPDAKKRCICTVFENHPKCLIWILAFLPIYEMYTRNIARFARNVIIWDFFCDFQTSCVFVHTFHTCWRSLTPNLAVSGLFVSIILRSWRSIGRTIGSNTVRHLSAFGVATTSSSIWRRSWTAPWRWTRTSSSLQK